MTLRCWDWSLAIYLNKYLNKGNLWGSFLNIQNDTWNSLLPHGITYAKKKYSSTHEKNSRLSLTCLLANNPCVLLLQQLHTKLLLLILEDFLNLLLQKKGNLACQRPASHRRAVMAMTSTAPGVTWVLSAAAAGLGAAGDSESAAEVSAAAAVGPLLVGSSWTRTLEPATSTETNGRWMKIHSTKTEVLKHTFLKITNLLPQDIQRHLQNKLNVTFIGSDSVSVFQWLSFSARLAELQKKHSRNAICDLKAKRVMTFTFPDLNTLPTHVSAF